MIHRIALHTKQKLLIKEIKESIDNILCRTQKCTFPSEVAHFLFPKEYSGSDASRMECST
jgi:hypothetical protein